MDRGRRGLRVRGHGVRCPLRLARRVAEPGRRGGEPRRRERGGRPRGPVGARRGAGSGGARPGRGALGRPGPRRFRRGLDPPVRVDRLRAGRDPVHAAAEQLRRPAPALDVRPAPRRGRALLAREPDPHPRPAPLPVRGRPADGRLRPAGGLSPDPAAHHGPGGRGPRRLRAAGVGRGLRGGRVPLLRGPRRLPGAHGRPRRPPERGGVEEPLPRPLRPAEGLPPRAARRPPAAVVVAPPPAAGRARSRRRGSRGSCGA